MQYGMLQWLLHCTERNKNGWENTKDTRGHYLFDMNCIRYRKKGRDEELVAQNSVQLAAAAADVE